MTLIRKEDHSATSVVAFRHLWGTTKSQKLLNSAETEPSTLYDAITPSLELGLPFIRTAVGAEYHLWPRLTELLPTSFPGVQSKRDSVVVDIDEGRLRNRMQRYFDADIPDEALRIELRRPLSEPHSMIRKRHVRRLTKRGMLSERVVRYLYRPFDLRWVYWENEYGLLSRRSPDLFEAVFDGNAFIEAREKQTGDLFSRGTYTSTLPDNFGNGFSSFFPMYLKEHVSNGNEIRPNLSQSLQNYLETLGLPAETIFRHVVAIVHSPSYRLENAGALRIDWPRVPVPASAERLSRSSRPLGRELAELVEPEFACSRALRKANCGWASVRLACLIKQAASH